MAEATRMQAAAREMEERLKNRISERLENRISERLENRISERLELKLAELAGSLQRTLGDSIKLSIEELLHRQGDEEGSS
ncbi:hypothetical protein Lal_00033725 [Lupinus albus]|nr:hypothetical protein Lal_00033725 [Lupinus albus]